MDINEIISEDRPIAQIIADLKDKTTPVPLWEELEEYYDPKSTKSLPILPSGQEINGKRTAR